MYEQAGASKEFSRRVCRLGACVATGALLFLSGFATAAEVAEPPKSEPEASAAPDVAAAEPAEIVVQPDERLHLRWFLFAGVVNAYPYMRSEKLIRQFYDPIMSAIAPGHDAVNTVGDLRDEHILLPPQFGLGVDISRRVSFSMQGGYAAGTVRTQADNTSIFLLLPWHEDFSIRRGAGYLGGGFDFYPLGRCELRKYEGLWDRCKAVKPFVGTSATMTRATYKAKVQLGIKNAPNIGIKLHDTWVLPSVNLHAGFDFPVTDRSAVSFNAGFNHFWEEEDDFEGWALSFVYKYYFH